MRNLILVLIISIQFIACVEAEKESINSKILNKIENEHNYFKLRALFEKHKNELSKDYQLYYSAMVNNMFGNYDESNKTIKAILENPKTSLNDSLLSELSQFQIINYINQYNYNKAAKTSLDVLNNYSKYLDSTAIDDLENTQKIWEVLKNIPKQEIIKIQDETIQMKRNKIGLLELEVTFETKTKSFVFDTGANFSVIQKSVAKELGLTIVKSELKVGTSTDIKITTDLAIADSIKIGNLIFKNVVFLVVEDKDMSFPQINLNIEGIIGFPVIKAMEEIHINKENQLFIPKVPKKYNFNNLAMNGFMPVISVLHQSDTLQFHFDTGAATTTLFAQYFKDYKNEIETKYNKNTFSSSGAGGTRAYEGFVLNNVNLKIAESEIVFDSIRLQIKDFDKSNENFHGNLGQDYIKQFDEMVLSFKYSSILFE